MTEMYNGTPIGNALESMVEERKAEKEPTKYKIIEETVDTCGFFSTLYSVVFTFLMFLFITGEAYGMLAVATISLMVINFIMYMRCLCADEGYIRLYIKGLKTAIWIAFISFIPFILFARFADEYALCIYICTAVVGGISLYVPIYMLHSLYKRCRAWRRE